jgi:predicted dehydrogenase
MGKVFKCAIAGYGYMGEIRKRVIDESPLLESIAVCEVDADKRKKVEGCEVVDQFDALLEREVDIIFVCLPNCFAPAATIKSLNMGKHVFCEKPPGRNLEDIEAVCKAEKSSNGRKLMFGFNHRYHPAVLKAKNIIKSGRLGNILGLRGVYGKSGGVGFPGSWRNNKEISGGGILLDQGIHMVDLFRYFCGDFEHVKCFVDNTCWNFEVEDNAYVALGNKKGQHALLHSSGTLWKHTFKMNIIMDEGYMIIDGLLSKSGSYGREQLVIAKKQFEDEALSIGNPAEEIMYFDRDLSWELEVEEFIKCITHDEPVETSSSLDALRAMKIIDAAYQDAEHPGMGTL